VLTAWWKPTLSVLTAHTMIVTIVGGVAVIVVAAGLASAADSYGAVLACGN
jgi:hypothetical protein